MSKRLSDCSQDGTIKFGSTSIHSQTEGVVAKPFYSGTIGSPASVNLPKESLFAPTGFTFNFNVTQPAPRRKVHGHRRGTNEPDSVDSSASSTEPTFVETQKPTSGSTLESNIQLHWQTSPEEAKDADDLGTESEPLISPLGVDNNHGTEAESLISPPGAVDTHSAEEVQKTNEEDIPAELLDRDGQTSATFQSTADKDRTSTTAPGQDEPEAPQQRRFMITDWDRAAGQMMVLAISFVLIRIIVWYGFMTYSLNFNA